MTIAVCIPTYCRPELLREALLSCLAQTKLPDEILIGDDSPDMETSKVVEEVRQSTLLTIRYFRNIPRAGQVRNIWNLYQRVEATHLLLLHDDDVLLPDAIEQLSSCWMFYPNLTAAFGKQYVMSHDGVRNEASSIELNKTYFRTPDRAGLQVPSWFSGLMQQFPNDGFLVRSTAAREIDCQEELADAIDYFFGVRLCSKFEGIFFLDRYTMAYRVTKGSISESLNCNPMFGSYLFLERMSLPIEADTARRRKLRELAPGAITQAVHIGNRREALRIYLSDFYPWRARLSVGGISKFAQIVLPRSAFDLIRCRISQADRHSG